MKTSAYIATSMDGFIARLDGAIDWLESTTGNGEDYGYQAFMDSVDALVMGRHTFEKMLTFETWFYGTKPVIVLSSHPLQIPEALTETVEAMTATPAEVIEQLSARGMTHLYVDGGRTIQNFIHAGLLDDMVITRVPRLIGEGIPLFGTIGQDVPLQHVQTQTFADGLVQSHYTLVR